MSYNWNWNIFFEPVAAGSGIYLDWLIEGLGWTVAVSLLAWAMAFVLGSVIGVVRTTPIPWAARLAAGYIEIFRNIPLLVQMFLWFFVLPELLPREAGVWLKQDMPLPEFTTAVVCLGFFTSARIAEQVRAGIQALPAGQKDAALALGMTLPQAYRHALLPLAYRLIVAPLTSEFMNVFKNSSVALTIGLLELTAQARQMNEYTFQGFETFTAATLLYVAVALTVNRGMAWVERRSHVPGYLGSGG